MNFDFDDHNRARIWARLRIRQKVVKFCHTWKKPNGAIVEKVQWCNNKQGKERRKNSLTILL
jgi:hypothetical protein